MHKTIILSLLFLFVFSLTGFAAEKSIKNNFYINEDFGFTAEAPDWFETAQNRNKMVYQKPGVTFEAFMISVDSLGENDKGSSALEYAQKIAKKVSKNSDTKIIEKPVFLKVGEFDATKLTYEFQNGKLETVYYFYPLNRKTIVVLMFLCEKESFLLERLTMAKYLRSFKKLKDEDNLGVLETLKNQKADFAPLDESSYLVLKNKIFNFLKKSESYLSNLEIKNTADEQLQKYDFKESTERMLFLSPKNFEFESYYASMNWSGDVWRIVDEDGFIKLLVWMPGFFNDVSDEFAKSRKEAYKELTIDTYKNLLIKYIPKQVANEEVDGKYVVLSFAPNDPGFMSSLPKYDYLKDSSINTLRVNLWVLKIDNSIRYANIIVKGKDKENKDFSLIYDHYFSNYNAPFTLGVPLLMSKEQALKFIQKEVK